MKKRVIFRWLFGMCTSMLILSGCNLRVPEAETNMETVAVTEPSEEGEITVDAAEKTVPSDGNLVENKDIYMNDKDYSVITMYLTVTKGNEADSSNHTWQEVNTYSAYDYQNMGVDRYKVEGVLQIDEEGEGIDSGDFGYGENVPNVSVQVRGQTSSRSAQKNYKIRIKDGKGDFRNQRTLDLNKHVGQPYRFENKLCYDLLKNIPELIGGRTQFVHLYVKDDTEEGSEDFADYGLYTMVEQVNRTYLKNHGLDENGHLYKVSFFEWNKYEEVMMSKDDPEFDQSKFDSYLEEKGDGDPSKLQEVIEEIHNYSKPIEKIVEEHFDERNLCYWMAFNILNGNVDVGARNLFIYSPLNSRKFYMICWDMDASFHKEYNKSKGRSDGESWEKGMTKFLGLALINRMMKVERYRNLLTYAVEDLYKNYVSPEIVNEKAESYSDIVKPYIFSMPDVEFKKTDSEEEFDELTSGLGDEVRDNYLEFQETMKRPWPFFIDMPIIDKQNNKTLISWGTSYDYNGEEVTYDYMIAKDDLFQEVIYEGHDLKIPLVEVDILEPGRYYLRVTSKNQSGYTMECFDYYVKSRGGKVYGCYCFTVDSEGKVQYIVKEKV